MKKLLFVMNHLHCGGAEKALISLLQTIDYSRYEVDLLLFERGGIFYDQIPQQVNLLEAPKVYRYFDMPIMNALLECLREKKIGIAIARIGAGLISRLEKNAARREQRVWRYLGYGMPKLTESYDAAIGYLEKNPVYFCIDKVNSRLKLGFIHNDYVQLGMDQQLDRKHFDKLNYLMTVSKECGIVLERTFPEYLDKVKIMHNIVSPSTITELSLQTSPTLPNRPRIAIISVGRLTPQKGFDMAIPACRDLLNKGMDIAWYVIGEGEERSRLESMIEQFGLKDRFILLGIKENPYPYVRQADIYVQPSRFEGKSIAVDEAKILGKPIVVTNFSTAADQIFHEINGLVVEMNAEGISAGIERFVLDHSLRLKCMNALQEEPLGTEQEIEKLYELLA
ncbi:glycosyltransferase [Paenibacillus sp. PL2-23]|uniref:glycosyltransferase n=1 Tax=Paenibacillus sp. PL2-23 TaxID=2100729 RepID=UPI0030FC36F8